MTGSRRGPAQSTIPCSLFILMQIYLHNIQAYEQMYHTIISICRRYTSKYIRDCQRENLLIIHRFNIRIKTHDHPSYRRGFERRSLLYKKINFFSNSKSRLTITIATSAWNIICLRRYIADFFIMLSLSNDVISVA